MAFGGEQGGEALPATLNRIKRSARGIKNDGTRLKSITKEAITMCTPELRESSPPIKKESGEMQRESYKCNIVPSFVIPLADLLILFRVACSAVSEIL